MKIELTKHQIEVLGHTNLACAKVLIDSGQYKQPPSEDSREYRQAVYIHWASGLLDKHGEGWKVEANHIIKELIAKNIQQRNYV